MTSSRSRRKASLELIEQIHAIVGASRRFGMVLDTESRQLAMPNSGDGVIVEIPVSDLQRLRKRLLEHRKAVILRRDLDPARDEIEHRLIRPPMPKLQFEGFGTARQRQ